MLLLLINRFNFEQKIDIFHSLSFAADSLVYLKFRIEFVFRGMQSERVKEGHTN